MKNKLILEAKKIPLLSKTYKEKFNSIVSDKLGIINAILERKELKKYGLYMFQSLTSKTKVLWNLEREVSSGGLGIDFSKKNAILSCMGESIERYCMSFFSGKNTKFCTWNKIQKNKRISNFNLYTNKQYKSTKFQNPKTKKITWVKIQKVISKRKEIYWPASLIYLPFNYDKVAETSSTGVASHTDLKKAILSGLMEVIERDALMINFTKRLNPPEIKIESINKTNKKLIKMIKKRFRIKIYKLYHDTPVPIYLSYIWRKYKNKIHFGIGASTNFDSDNAIKKSLMECLFTYFYSKNLMDLRKSDPNEITALYEHFLYYQGNKFKHLLFKSKKINYIHEKCSIKKLKDFFRKKEIEVFYINLTTPDIEKTTFKVVKVIIPGFIDLNKSHVLIRQKASRFFFCAKKT